MCTIYICPSPNTPSPTRAPRETGVAHVARGAAVSVRCAAAEGYVPIFGRWSVCGVPAINSIAREQTETREAQSDSERREPAPSLARPGGSGESARRRADFF